MRAIGVVDQQRGLVFPEAGAGGSLMNEFGDSFGATGQITMITPDGDSSVVVDGLISFGGADAGGVSGM